MRLSARLALSGALLLCVVAGGCGRKIGDPCLVSTDCSWRGERSCDLSHRVTNDGVPNPAGKGECIIDGCTSTNCPREGVCVKIYPSQFLSVACDPVREDVAVEGDTDGCSDGVCAPRDDCDAHEVCLREGVCADAVTSRTSCRKECKRDSQCRKGYHCESTGQNGVYRLPPAGDPTRVDETSICVPDV
jgi:hypothetical protein